MSARPYLYALEQRSLPQRLEPVPQFEIERPDQPKLTSRRNGRKASANSNGYS